MLDVMTLTWRYVGERGAQPPPRNSHSMHILSMETTSYLVIFGGAHPELGPLNDCYVSLLPKSLHGNSSVVYKQSIIASHG